MLVFDAGDVGGFDIFGIRQLRTLGREEGVLIVKMVHQETGGEDVAAGEVGLQLGEIAEAQHVIVVGADGQRGVDECCRIRRRRRYRTRFSASRSGRRR